MIGRSSPVNADLIPALERSADDCENMERWATPEPHPSKWREADTSAVARWMMGHGYATGHGDTLDDMLGELAYQVHANALLEFHKASSVTSTERHVSREAMDWAASQAPMIEAYKADNPDAEKDFKSARDVIGGASPSKLRNEP